MALNIKALLPIPEHPPVSPMAREDRTDTGDHGSSGDDHAFDPNRGNRGQALEMWRQIQRKRKSASTLQLLDVL